MGTAQVKVTSAVWPVLSDDLTGLHWNRMTKFTQISPLSKTHHAVRKSSLSSHSLKVEQTDSVYHIH